MNKKAYTLIVFDTDKQIQKIFTLFDEEKVNIMSFEKEDYYSTDNKFSTIVFCNSKLNAGREIELINHFFNTGVICKDTQIIHLESIFKF